MGAIASQITSLTVVYSIVYSDVDQRKHQSSASLAFVRGIHRGPVNSPHKRPVTRKMFPFDDVIMCCMSLWYMSHVAGVQYRFKNALGFKYTCTFMKFLCPVKYSVCKRARMCGLIYSRRKIQRRWFELRRFYGIANAACMDSDMYLPVWSVGCLRCEPVNVWFHT